MRPSTKHQNQQTVILNDFTGGMNTNDSDEMIAQNQMSYLVNMEIGKSGKLRTVQGTVDIADISQYLSSDIISAAWDEINSALLLFCLQGATYAMINGTVTRIGTLTGLEEVVTINWEDGLLIASGGKLQYAKYVTSGGTRAYKLTTINTSPAKCCGVYVRSGRVFVFDNQDNLIYSAVGDEENWQQDSNDPSAAIFTQIGYKVGGRIIGLINMQRFVLIIKDNGKVFRLENEFPDWVIQEVTSNGLCKGKHAYASVGNNVFILGDKTLQIISPTDDQGNMPINYVGRQVDNEIASLPKRTKMRFNVDLNQLWFITNSQWVLVYDCNTQTFFQRYFNSDVVDLVKNYIIKRGKISEISMTDGVMQDDGEPLEYRARFKTETTFHDLLVKKVELDIMPLVDFYTDAAARVKVGKITVPFPDRVRSADGSRTRVVGVTDEAKEPEYSPVDGQWNESTGRWSVDNSADVFLNEERVYHGMSLRYKKRQVSRSHMVNVELSGSGFPFILNFISYDRVEV